MTSTKPEPVVIRCDASLAIGSGHVMRCLNIARGLRDRQTDVHFICNLLPGDLITHIRDCGFSAHTLDPSGDDAQQTLALLPAPRTVIVDHYTLGEDWHRRLAFHGHRLVVIDDLADRFFDCDMLINPNIYPPDVAPYTGFVRPGTALHIGPDYALINPSACPHRGVMLRVPESIERVVIFFGGSDLVNMTEKSLRAALAITPAIAKIDVVLGKNYLFGDSLFPYRDKENVTLRDYIADFPGFIAGADLFIGAGGSTQLERCCLGIPALVTAIADNQIIPAQNMVASGASLYLGWHEDVTVESLEIAMKTLTDDPIRLQNMARRAYALVDGKGIERVCRLLLH